MPHIFQELLVQNLTQVEIQQALRSLGPFKAVGPDGFHAKIIQDNWQAFGPAITNEAQNFFEIGVMRSDVARSNLVLIPKSDEAITVGQFRPISVCNITYKLISKILTLRMKPFIHSLVSGSQCAFILSRDISENIILFREILHTFKQKKIQEQGVLSQIRSFQGVRPHGLGLSKGAPSSLWIPG